MTRVQENERYEILFLTFNNNFKNVNKCEIKMFHDSKIFYFTKDLSSLSKIYGYNEYTYIYTSN